MDVMSAFKALAAAHTRARTVYYTTNSELGRGIVRQSLDPEFILFHPDDLDFIQSLFPYPWRLVPLSDAPPEYFLSERLKLRAYLRPDRKQRESGNG